MSHNAIQQLIFEYARRLDGGDLPGVADLFRWGRICSAQGEVAGYQEVLDLYQRTVRLYDNGTPYTMHITSNLQIEVEDQQASCHSYFCVMQSLADFPLQTIIGGRYEDTLVLADGHWRFDRRHILPTLFGDLSRHLLNNPMATDD